MLRGLGTWRACRPPEAQARPHDRPGPGGQGTGGDPTRL